jgi:putative salt-induced outer membrane protein YdiY
MNKVIRKFQNNFGLISGLCLFVCICFGISVIARAAESPWDSFVPPPDDKFDWIQLTSGEWLKGRLKVLYNYEVEFDSDELDLQTFDLEDVKRIRTHKPQSIRIEDKELSDKPIIVQGIVNIVDDKVMVTVDNETREFTRDQVVSIAQADKKERDMWSGNISLGANFRGGNTETTDLNVIMNLKRRTVSSRLAIDYLGNFSRAGGVETSNNHRLGGSRDVTISKNFFWRQLGAEYYRDRFKNIDSQFSLATGLGYQIIFTSKTKWDVTAGVGGRYTKYVSVLPGESIDNTTPAGGAGTLYDTELTSWMDFLLDYSFQIVDEEAGRYTHHFITTLSNDLIGDIDLDFSFVWDRIQKPQPDSEGNVPDQDDYQLIVAFSYDI